MKFHWQHPYSLLSLLVLMFLPACGASQSEREATITQIVVNIFNTQTAQAPTSTRTPTPTQTSTITPTPTLTPTPTVTPTPTLPPTPTPIILFSDDFSDPASGWFVISDEAGTTDYSDGSYQMEITSTNYFTWSGLNRDFRNVIIDVDVQKTGVDGNFEFGVFCRMQDENNFYNFSIDDQGYYGIFKLIDNEWASIGRNDWGFNDLIIHTGNQSNHIRASCIGNNLVLEVNGNVLMDVFDSDLSSGDVGLTAGTYETGGLVVQFDNFQVTKP